MIRAPFLVFGLLATPSLAAPAISPLGVGAANWDRMSYEDIAARTRTATRRAEIEAAAMAGDGEAATLAACASWRGWWGSPDVAQGKAWAQRAADLGFAPGMTELALILEAESPDQVASAQAIEWFRKAAAAGSADAMTHLSRLYGTGKAVRRSRDEQIGWMQRAAQAGSPFAAAALREAGLPIMPAAAPAYRRTTAPSPAGGLQDRIARLATVSSLRFSTNPNAPGLSSLIARYEPEFQALARISKDHNAEAMRFSSIVSWSQRGNGYGGADPGRSAQLDARSRKIAVDAVQLIERFLQDIPATYGKIDVSSQAGQARQSIGFVDSFQRLVPYSIGTGQKDALNEPLKQALRGLRAQFAAGVTYSNAEELAKALQSAPSLFAFQTLSSSFWVTDFAENQAIVSQVPPFGSYRQWMGRLSDQQRESSEREYARQQQELQREIAEWKVPTVAGGPSRFDAVQAIRKAYFAESPSYYPIGEDVIGMGNPRAIHFDYRYILTKMRCSPGNGNFTCNYTLQRERQPDPKKSDGGDVMGYTVDLVSQVAGAMGVPLAANKPFQHTAVFIRSPKGWSSPTWEKIVDDEHRVRCTTTREATGNATTVKWGPAVGYFPEYENKTVCTDRGPKKP